jgi:hypothetical protein
MSKKFTFVTIQIQDGDHENFDYTSFLTSDFQKLKPMQLIAKHFKNDHKEELMIEDNDVFWIDDTRTSYIYNHQTISLEEHDLLEKLEILFSKPKQIFKKESNVIQLKRKVG